MLKSYTTGFSYSLASKPLILLTSDVKNSKILSNLGLRASLFTQPGKLFSFLVASPYNVGGEIHYFCGLHHLLLPWRKQRSCVRPLRYLSTFNNSCSQLNGIRYILLHHAINADREIISKWLKVYTGMEVRFIVENKEYKGILYRLAQGVADLCW